MTHFVQTQKQKQLLMKVTLTIHLNQFMLQLYQTYKNRQEKVQAGLLIRSLIIVLVFQSTILWMEAVILNYQENYNIMERIS